MKKPKLLKIERIRLLGASMVLLIFLFSITFNASSENNKYDTLKYKSPIYVNELVTYTIIPSPILSEIFNESELEKLMYIWNFGDGSNNVTGIFGKDIDIHRGINVTHIYKQDGEYSITIYITDNAGWQAEYIENVTVIEKKTDDNFCSMSLLFVGGGIIGVVIIIVKRKNK